MSNQEKQLLFVSLQQSMLNQAMLLRLIAGKNDDTVNTAIKTSRTLADKLGAWSKYNGEQGTAK
jgi:hypothetical protein